MAYQLTFNVSLPKEANFTTFYPGKNQSVIDYLKSVIVGVGELGKSEQFIYIWGKEAFGKTHLLQACCHFAREKNRSAFYLSLTDFDELIPSVFVGLEKFSIICLDDIDAIAKQPEWEEQLFHLFNRIHTSGAHLIMTAQQPPQQLPIQLADLGSRLAWSVVLQMQPLTDNDKCQALKLHANARGMKLPDNVGEFLLHRCSRDMHDLSAILEKLDEVSLREQRKLTVPFVKMALGI